MRRTATLRLFIVDRSVLAKNMYELLFQELPGYKLEFGDSTEGLLERQRRARPHVVLINGNAIEKGVRPDFVDEYPIVCLAGADRQDLKALGRELETFTIVEKPFYPYDLITVINRVASQSNPLSSGTDPAPAPRRRRMRKAKGV